MKKSRFAKNQRSTWRDEMKGLSIGLVFAFIVLPIVFAASRADARAKDHPNYGYCKSMKRVFDVKNCRENGGRW
jgi:hypothetical protein